MLKEPKMPKDSIFRHFLCAFLRYFQQSRKHYPKLSAERKSNAALFQHKGVRG